MSDYRFFMSNGGEVDLLINTTQMSLQRLAPAIAHGMMASCKQSSLNLGPTIPDPEILANVVLHLQRSHLYARLLEQGHFLLEVTKMLAEKPNMRMMETADIRVICQALEKLSEIQNLVLTHMRIQNGSMWDSGPKVLFTEYVGILQERYPVAPVATR